MQDFANNSLADKIAPKQFRCFNFQRTYLQVVSAASPRRILWGCVKMFFTALRAKLNLDGDIFFLILLRKIRKKMSPSKEYFAAEGGKNLFTQPLSKDNLARSAIKILFTQLQYFFPGRALLNSYLSTSIPKKMFVSLPDI